MNSGSSQDWHSWLPATQATFIRILQAKGIKKYQPNYQDIINIFMFPLGDDVAAIKALRQKFREKGPFDISVLGIDDQSNAWIQCHSATDKFSLCVSSEQRTAFLAKHGHLAAHRGLNDCEPKSQLEAESSQWVVVSDLSATEDRYNNEWLVIDTSEP